MNRAPNRPPRWRAAAATAAAVALAITGTALPAAADPADDFEPLPGVGGTPFSDGGGWIYNYSDETEPYDYMDKWFDYGATTWNSVTDKIEDGYYADRGITNMIVYGPYLSTGAWRGLPATGDFMDSDPKNGTVEEFRQMVSAANARGMTITAYLALLYVDFSSPLFTQAERDKRDGIDSWQTKLFLWDERPQGSDPNAAPPSNSQIRRPSNGDWDYSETAGRWYATTWGLPALNFASPTAMDYAKKVLRFWMDNGVQGFEFDAPQSMWGFQSGGDGLGEARNREFVNYPHEYRPDWEVYTHAEGSGTYSNQALMDRLGYTHIMVNPDDDFNSFSSRIGRYPQENTVDSLEAHYESFIDHRRLLGRGTYAPAVYDMISLPDGLRALDLAVQGGNGAIVSMDQQGLLDVLSPEEVDAMDDVTEALHNSPAEAPSALRDRVPTQQDTRAYAVLRRSVKGPEAALNLFSYKNVASCITVNLEGTGIAYPQRTTNLLTGEPGPWLRSAHSTVSLPAYGWLYLDVDADEGPAWTYVDGADAGWTYGGGWVKTDDPSAYGGSRHGGTAQGGFGEITFTGSTVEGYGRATSNGSTQVEVFVDGVSKGVHTERRNESGGPFQGTKFFSITGLSDGPHTLRIQQNNAASGNAGGSSIDYLRVAHEQVVTPQTLPAGDVCDTDETAPVSTATLAGANIVGTTYESPTVTIASADEEGGSGLDRVEYRLDGGEWAEYGEPFAVNARGDHTLEYRASDVAGNVETAKSVAFSVVSTAGDGAGKRPDAGVLSSNSGWANGLHDGNYDITMNLWWGENGSVLRLYENGELVALKSLATASPAAQAVSVPFRGKPNGTYVYTATLVNSKGETATGSTTVKVTDAAPGKPALSHDNWDKDGSFTLTADLWWGTNATSYEFFEGATSKGTGTLTAATPAAQKATVQLTGVAKGTHTYRVVFRNAAGETASDQVQVVVSK
ncbi:hypothetical protein ET445_02565 [Agromyces protaetiae]|uniref:Glycosyl hydrolase family 13 catalytic domain-containing protein n=1 Tax=Agromyces protaetiae TaxID=2509455 RepID=A0A4P6F9D6_9MICO|nr:alpha-amylase family glycosyl hydrolase [Agromyces protaetiae]QAY72384.1 hypothetical protein ET445_02565 [Agromyces protaetiae]